MQPIAITGEQNTKPKRKPKLAVGDYVRVKQFSNVFTKGYEVRWSKKVYQISSVVDGNYTLDNGETYRADLLQKVSKANADAPIVKDAAKKAKREYKVEKQLKAEDIKKERIQRAPRFKNYIPVSILEQGADIEGNGKQIGGAQKLLLYL